MSVCGRWQIAPAAGGQVVEHADHIAPGDKGVAKVRADEAGTPGHQIGTHQEGQRYSHTQPARDGAAGRLNEAVVDFGKLMGSQMKFLQAVCHVDATR